MDECIICFDPKIEYITFDCNHSICLLCYEKLLASEHAACPMCRTPIDNNPNTVKPDSNFDVQDIQDQENNYNHWYRECISGFFILFSGFYILMIQR